MPIRRNPLMDQAAADRHQDDSECCKHNFCRACGAHVSGYNANGDVIAVRPEAIEWDWWIACDNADCEHAFGEGLFQTTPDWVEERKPHFAQPALDDDRSFLLRCAERAVEAYVLTAQVPITAVALKNAIAANADALVAAQMAHHNQTMMRPDPLSVAGPRQLAHGESLFRAFIERSPS